MAIDFDKLETIFEHNITKEEIIGFFASEISRSEYIEALKSSYKTDESIMYRANVALYNLYYWRGEKQKAMIYADRLPDCDHKWFTLMNHCLH